MWHVKMWWHSEAFVQVFCQAWGTLLTAAELNISWSTEKKFYLSFFRMGGKCSGGLTLNLNSPEYNHVDFIRFGIFQCVSLLFCSLWLWIVLVRWWSSKRYMAGGWKNTGLLHAEKWGMVQACCFLHRHVLRKLFSWTARSLFST